MTSLEGAASVPPSKGSQERRKPIPDDFLFGKMIGEGSFSCVFLAKDIRSSKEVAIKVRNFSITFGKPRANSFVFSYIHEKNMFYKMEFCVHFLHFEEFKNTANKLETS